MTSSSVTISHNSVLNEDDPSSQVVFYIGSDQIVESSVVASTQGELETSDQDHVMFVSSSSIQMTSDLEHPATQSAEKGPKRRSLAHSKSTSARTRRAKPN